MEASQRCEIYVKSRTVDAGELGSWFKSGDRRRELCPMDAEKIPVFLVDDHAMVRAGLRALLSAQPDIEVVGEAGEGRVARAEIAGCAPRVAVLVHCHL